MRRNKQGQFLPKEQQQEDSEPQEETPTSTPKIIVDGEKQEPVIKKDIQALIEYYQDNYTNVYIAETFIGVPPAVTYAEICRLLFGVMGEIKKLKEAIQQNNAMRN